MKPCGHTMGTPEFTPDEAVDFFADLGYEAIEFLCLEDYLCAVSPTAPSKTHRELAKKIRDRGLEPACLTPYVTDLNHPDDNEYQKQKDMLKRAVEIAADIGFKFVRVYGGRLVEAEKREGSVDRLVKALQECAPTAKSHNVILAVENHYNTLTVTAEETMEVIRAADHPAVKVLYDQCNITQMAGEDYREAINLQKDHIVHVHLKDLVFKSNAVQEQAGDVTHIDPSKRAVRSRVIGNGIIPWPEIIKELDKIGYEDYLSVEYGRKWYPEDLPVPQEGLKESLQFIRKCLSNLD